MRKLHKLKINEEYGEYKDDLAIEYIASKIEEGNQFGYEPYEFGSWELEAYFDGSEDLFGKNSNLTDNMQDYLCREISYPVHDGHIKYYGLDIIIYKGSGVSKEDLLSLDPNHDLFDENDIDTMLNDEDGSKEIEFWIDYEVKYKEDIEIEDEEENIEYVDESLNLKNRKKSIHEKIKREYISPKRKFIYDEMEDETGMNSIEEECVGGMASTGTAPSPAVGHVSAATVNGKAVPSKSSKKKSLKELTEELKNLLK